MLLLLSVLQGRRVREMMPTTTNIEMSAGYQGSTLKAPPAVSVVVPIYNVEKYVEQCVSSVRDQTFADFEAICVDDGSIDDSISIAKATVEGDERFVFLSQPNAGLSVARNTGMSRASGKYVIFLDSDDYWRKDTLALLYEKMESESLDALFFSAQSVYESIEMRGVHREEYSSRSEVPGVMTGAEYLVASKDARSFQESAVMQMLKRSLLEDNEISFYEGILHEDNLFTMLVLAYAQRVAFLNEPLYRRLIRENSIMTSQSVRNVYGRYKCASELEKWVAANGDEYETEFIEAVLSHATLCYQFAAEGAEAVGEDALRNFARNLDPLDRWAFWMNVVERMRMLAHVRDEYAESTSYRIGSAVTAVPRWLKDRFGNR